MEHMFLTVILTACENAFELFLLYLHYPFPPLFRLSLLPFLLLMTLYFHFTSFWILFIAYYFDFFKYDKVGDLTDTFPQASVLKHKAKC